MPSRITVRKRTVKQSLFAVDSNGYLSMAVGDFNADGHLDLALVNGGTMSRWLKLFRLSIRSLFA
jgi:hypothetical protein